MQLSENFTLEEFVASATAKRLDINNIPGKEQINNLKKLCQTILQPIRNEFSQVITVTSGYRSELLNRAVGGSKTSQHLKGEAADIICYDNKRLWELITSMINKGVIRVGQLINERNLSWIHISLPSTSSVNQILFL